MEDPRKPKWETQLHLAGPPAGLRWGDETERGNGAQDGLGWPGSLWSPTQGACLPLMPPALTEPVRGVCGGAKCMSGPLSSLCPLLLCAEVRWTLAPGWARSKGNADDGGRVGGLGLPALFPDPDVHPGVQLLQHPPQGLQGRDTVAVHAAHGLREGWSHHPLKGIRQPFRYTSPLPPAHVGPRQWGRMHQGFPRGSSLGRFTPFLRLPPQHPRQQGVTPLKIPRVHWPGHLSRSFCVFGWRAVFRDPHRSSPSPATWLSSQTLTSCNHDHEILLDAPTLVVLQPDYILE